MKHISYTRAVGQLYKFDIPVLYADVRFGRNINSQAELQKACISWATWNIENARYRIHFAGHESPNISVQANASTQADVAKKMGIRNGFPDLWISLKNGETGYIFFKFGKDKLTREQFEFRDFLQAEGHKWGICRTVDEFIKTLSDWGLSSKHKKQNPFEQENTGKSEKIR